jgi:hypothetical protein
MKRSGEPDTNVAPVATRLWVDAAISSRDFASYKSVAFMVEYFGCTPFAQYRIKPPMQTSASSFTFFVDANNRYVICWCHVIARRELPLGTHEIELLLD